MKMTTERRVIDGGSWKQVIHTIKLDGVEVGEAYEHEICVNFEGEGFNAQYDTLDACKRDILLRARRFAPTVRMMKALDQGGGER